jgi:hypothetical protein
MLTNQNTKFAVLTAGVMYFNSVMNNASKTVNDFTTKQVQLNRHLADFNAAGSLFGKNVGLSAFREEMNLTI